MSSNQSENSLTEEQIEELRFERYASLEIEFDRFLKERVLPLLLMPEDILSSMDVLLGVDRRIPMVSSLRKLSVIIEGSSNDSLIERM